MEITRCLVKLFISDGFWYQLYRFVSMLIITNNLFLQVSSIGTTSLELDYIANDIVFIMLTSMLIVKQVSFYLSSMRIKQIFNDIEICCSELNKDEEQKILKHYFDMEKHFVKIFMLILLLVLGVNFLTSIFPLILNIVSPLNESRTLRLPYDCSYFLNYEGYFPLIVIQTYSFACFGSILLFSTEAIAIIIVQRYCGLIKIVSYHLEHAMDLCEAQNAAERCSTIFAKLFKAIRMHNQFIKIFKAINETFGTCYEILLFAYMIDVTLQLYYVVQTVKQMRSEIYSITLMLLGKLGYMFIISYLGQDIINHTDEVSQKAYDSLWYTAPVRARKLLLFTMLNNAKPSAFTMLGGLFKTSFEVFLTIVRLCFSYCMFLYSTQN